jgi:hypothetical protein
MAQLAAGSFFFGCSGPWSVAQQTPRLGIHNATYDISMFA